MRYLKAPLHLLHELVDAEARWPLARRILLEGGQEWRHDGLRRDEWTRSVRYEPVIVGIRRDIGAFVGIGPQVEEFRDTQLGKRLGPDSHRARRALLLEHELPVFVAERDEIAIIVEVDELLARATVLLSGEVRELVIAVEMHLPGLAAGLVSLQQLVLDVGIAGGRHQGRQPVEGADDVVRDRAWLNAPRPA